MAEAAMAFVLQSTAFENGMDIPQKYTCEGADISPPLSWSGAPKNTKSFVLIVDDPDAPDPAAPKVTWVHWVLYNIPSKADRLEENASKELPKGTQAGRNDFKKKTWGGPCPPVGKHHYHFKLYALDSHPHFMATPDKAQLEKAMQSHILAQAELIGLFQKH